MHTLLPAIPAALLLVSNAIAQSTDYPAPEGATSAVQVTVPLHAYHISRHDSDFASGHYDLSNGWSLKVTATSLGIDAAIDREPTMHLIAVGPDRYATRSGYVVMDFNLGGDPDAMQMSYVPRSNLAAVIVVRTPMASR